VGGIATWLEVEHQDLASDGIREASKRFFLLVLPPVTRLAANLDLLRTSSSLEVQKRKILPCATATRWTASELQQTLKPALCTADQDKSLRSAKERTDWK
jgi:hypothetical protein